MFIEGSKRTRDDLDLARLYHALGEPTRVRIVRLLAENEGLTCGEIAERLGVSCSTLSHHLGLMYGAGLVGWRKEGTYRIYRLHRDVLREYAPAVA